MPSAVRYDLFLSHASEDAHLAKSLRQWLEKIFDIKVFVASIAPGDDWRYAIDQALGQSRVGFVLATPNSVRRPWVNYEVGRMEEADKPIFTFCHHLTVERIGSILDRIQTCFWNSDEEKQREFVEAIAVRLEKQPHLIFIDKNPLVEPVSPTVCHFQNRQASHSEVVKIIQDACSAETELCVAGVANTMFFSGAVAEVSKALQAALSQGLRARFIFLDPKSGVARRRHIYELSREVETFKQIEICKSNAERFSKRYPGRVQIRLAQDMPFFTCFNHQNLILQPYLNTEVGAESFTWKSGLDARTVIAKHFDNLWGNRWVLFDLGNILVPFDHARISRSLLEHFPRSKRDVRFQDKIHRFIFDANNTDAKSSRNELLDRGKRDLAWLCSEFCKKFGVKIVPRLFQEAWCSIFDAAHVDSLKCLSAVRELDVNVAICSNTNEAHWEYICKKYPEIKGKGTEHFLSFQTKFLKSEPEFFDAIVSRTSRPHEDHVLIDDLTANIVAAEKCRLRAIHLTPPVRFETVQDFLTLHQWI